MPLCFPKIYQRAMDLDGMGCGRDIGGVGGGETVIREKKTICNRRNKRDIVYTCPCTNRYKTLEVIGF